MASDLIPPDALRRVLREYARHRDIDHWTPEQVDQYLDYLTEAQSHVALAQAAYAEGVRAALAGAEQATTDARLTTVWWAYDDSEGDAWEANAIFADEQHALAYALDAWAKAERNRCADHDDEPDADCEDCQSMAAYVARLEWRKVANRWELWDRGDAGRVEPQWRPSWSGVTVAPNKVHWREALAADVPAAPANSAVASRQLADVHAAAMRALTPWINPYGDLATINAERAVGIVLSALSEHGPVSDVPATICGAVHGSRGPCPLPAGHNMGRADVPENHYHPAACPWNCQPQCEACGDGRTPAERLRDRVADADVPAAADHEHPGGYLSTACLHGHHKVCGKAQHANGDPSEPHCKFCETRCSCPKHTDPLAPCKGGARKRRHHPSCARPDDDSHIGWCGPNAGVPAAGEAEVPGA